MVSEPTRGTLLRSVIMRRVERWLPRVTAAVLTATTLTASDPPATESERHTVSHYMVVPADQAGAERVGYHTGCRDGRAGAAGPRALFFGAQERGGRIRPPGTTTTSPAARVGIDAVERAAAGWIRGWTTCGSTRGTVAIAVNNKPGDGVDAGEAGRAWAALVERVSAAAPAERVVVAGGMDGEPGWGGPAWVRGWVAGYLGGTRRSLYAAGSADGCPPGDSPAGNGGACLNGWTVADVHYVSTGAGPTVLALPQIYRTDGVQARQWAWISRWGARSGRGPLRVAGALSQQRACQQRSGCARTDNPPSAARTQLIEALNGDPGTRVETPLGVTDVAWPEDRTDNR